MIKSRNSALGLLAALGVMMAPAFATATPAGEKRTTPPAPRSQQRGTGNKLARKAAEGKLGIRYRGLLPAMPGRFPFSAKNEFYR